MKKIALKLISLFALSLTSSGQPSVESVKPTYTQIHVLSESDPLVGNWQFFTEYFLPGSATQPSIPERQKSIPPRFQESSISVEKNGSPPSQRFTHLMDGKTFPSKSFSLELWINDHVSEEIGFLVSARPRQPSGTNGWFFNYHSKGYSYRDMSFGLGSFPRNQSASNQITFSNTEKDGFKEYWRQIVAVYQNKKLSLYVNGELKGQSDTLFDAVIHDDFFLDVSAYLDKEPYMEIGNLVHRMRLYDVALQPDKIRSNLEELKEQVEAGILFEDTFHFNAQPFIGAVSENSASIVWETSAPSTATIRWGTKIPLDKSHTIKRPKKIQKLKIPGLQPNTPYFYQIEVDGGNGKKMDSGLLSFRTSVKSGEPFRFAIIGDTETRPHINQQISRMIWDERPNFIVNMGDLTDGGKQNAKFQWNYEYLLGMTPLASRVPVFSVPGNGEGDLYWYRRYHLLPDDEVPYAFNFGDATFFMLDSNRRSREFAKGTRQYEWLENQLQNSKSTWKFVALHHAPYTSEENDYGNSWSESSTLGDTQVQQLIPLFEKYNVDIVMFGHLHLGERTYPIREKKYSADGVVYVLAGGGGGNLEDFSPNPAFFTGKTHRNHHYFTVEIIESKLTLRMHDMHGNLRDQTHIDKSK